ncbi:MAG: YegS/Rv2252/BmrU family lipid kinase [Bacteroidales bacterium]|nr:YegS/Rv2252/BmrU family lipid kinase [Bacteroidales bacterium]
MEKDIINTKDIIFIINPNSGKKQIHRIINQIKNHKSELSFFISSSYQDFFKFTEQNIQKYKVFVIVGGDGTINSSINLFYKYPDKILAIIPAGSGNGFAKETGFKKDLNSLVEDIVEGKTIEIDILEVNGKKFVNAFGIGFDSIVAHDFAGRKKRGLVSYTISVIKSIFTFKPFLAEITFENNTITGKFNMVVIANTSQFGNNARIAPSAKPNSNNYVAVLVKPFPVFIYPGFIIKLFTGKLKNSRYIEFNNNSSELIIKTSFQKYHIDGEPMLNNGIYNIKISSRKIKFIKTKSCKL